MLSGVSAFTVAMQVYKWRSLDPSKHYISFENDDCDEMSTLSESRSDSENIYDFNLHSYIHKKVMHGNCTFLEFKYWILV